MTELDSEVRELLDRWAASPATPVSELTLEAVRKDDLAVLDLQRAPGELYSVEDVEAPGPAGALPVRVYRRDPERLHPVLFLHGGGFVIGRDGYDAPLRELALASGCMIVSPRVPTCSGAPVSRRSGRRACRGTVAERRGISARRVPHASRRRRRQLGREPCGNRHPRAYPRGCASVRPGAHLPDPRCDGQLGFLRRIRLPLRLLAREVALVLRPLSAAPGRPSSTAGVAAIRP